MGPAVSNSSIIALIAACSGAFGLAAWVGLIALPAWHSYGRVWERVAAVVLSLYSVAAFVVVGFAGGALVIWFWDRITL
jgi:hypothetical protein